MANKNIEPIFEYNAINACRSLEDMDSLLMIVESNLLHESVILITKELLSKYQFGIYICLNKPHDTIKKMLIHSSINTDKLYFVDCVTALVDKTLTKKAKVLYMPSPQHLSIDGTIPFAITKFISSVPGDKFLIVDALRTLFIYNEPQIVSVFIHSLLLLTKEHDIKVIVLTRKEDDMFIKQISSVFDEIIIL